MSLISKLIYQLYERPRDRLLNCGPRQRWLTEKGRREMEASAYKLPLPPAVEGSPVVLHFLTGKKYWYQTAFCLLSFARAAQRPIHPVLFDDGSLSIEHTAAIQRLFPSLRVVSAAESLTRLDKLLPETRYPSLRARRLVFPLLKKLIDIHVGQKGYRLQLDSDLLFFRRPDWILEWYDNPQYPLRTKDLDKDYYGYPNSLLLELSEGRPIPEGINTGVVGINSEDFDWDKMEYWCGELLKRGGASYYQEQALFALLLAGREQLIPDPKDYIQLPWTPEALECKAVMHHYVGTSQRWYFQKNWRRFVTQ